MEEILFWVMSCDKCGSWISAGGPDYDEEDNLACPQCGAIYSCAFDTVTRSKLDQLELETLLNVKRTLNGLIEKKLKEAKDGGS